MFIWISQSAQHKADSIASIRALSRTIARHFIYCLCYPRATEIQHWVTELTAALTDVNGDMRIKGGMLKEKVLHETLFNTYLETLEEFSCMCIEAIDHNNYKPSWINAEDLGDANLKTAYTLLIKMYKHIEQQMLTKQYRRQQIDQYIKAQLETLY